MNLYDALRSYISQCPALQGGRIDMDFLPASMDAYALEFTPCEPVVKKYLDGSSMRRVQFTLSSRRAYSRNLAQNEGNLVFFDSFSRWLERQNQLGLFPDLPAPLEAVSVSALSCGYVFDVDKDSTARYQIACQLKYFQPNPN